MMESNSDLDDSSSVYTDSGSDSGPHHPDHFMEWDDDWSMPSDDWSMPSDDSSILPGELSQTRQSFASPVSTVNVEVHIV